MRKVFLLGMLTGVMWGQQPDHQPAPSLTPWKWSVVGLSAATALDIGSSWGREELNPILGRGTFGPRQAGVKLGIVGGSVLTEWLWLQHHPQHARIIATVNVGATGLTVGVAIRNFKLR